MEPHLTLGRSGRKVGVFRAENGRQSDHRRAVEESPETYFTLSSRQNYFQVPKAHLHVRFLGRFLTSDVVHAL
jgi:hypothetical protein